MNKNLIFLFFIIFLTIALFSNESKKLGAYPFIYIPGMFDNGDLLNKDNQLVVTLNNEDGFYFNNYFSVDSSETRRYGEYKIDCSSNIVDSKYERLSVANLIGPTRTNISLDLMSDRLFAFIQGRSPKFRSYKSLINHKGNDYGGFVEIDGQKIYFKGLVEEIWAKYGEKVYYVVKNRRAKVVLEPKKDSAFYLNKNYYFQDYKEIKFNVVAHSSGGLAIRKYLDLCEDNKAPNHINSIINLSIPQKGARMLYDLKGGFYNLIDETIKRFYQNIDNSEITFTGKKAEITFSYKDLDEQTNINWLKGNSGGAKFLKGAIRDYILYFIPFDGLNNYLGTDPALWDLHPSHAFIKSLNKTRIPNSIILINYMVENAYSPAFKNIGQFLGLYKNDGVVDIKDTYLDNVPNFTELNIKNITVERANHIPMPYIKPLFELRETVTKNYPFLKILCKKVKNKEDGIDKVQAVISVVMKEMGLELDHFLKHENYSVIDYFADNPVVF